MSSFFSGETYDWSDVKPVPQDDGPAPVAAIKYSSTYRELMNYFRAILVSEEYSARTVALTEEILTHNAANYTVWHFRRNAIKALDMDLGEEIDFMDRFAGDNPKNYQIWHHRREIARLRDNCERELTFTQNVFEIDPKNYHAWAHRQWALRHFNVWDNELTFVEELMKKDIRNNSAWNQRWFVVHNRGVAMLSTEQLQAEINFCFGVIDTSGVKSNESVWNYLRGLAFEHPSIQVAVLNQVQEFIEDNSACVYAVSLLADLHMASGTVQDIQEACGLFSLLVSLDPLRAKAWVRRGQEAEASLLEARAGEME